MATLKISGDKMPPWRAGPGVLAAAELGKDPGFEERLDQRHDALVLDPGPHPLKNGGV
jgi:hypothetical protein